MGANLQITYLLVKRMRVSNACNTNFSLFIVLGDESRRAVVSREAKKKQHAHASSGQCDHYSELDYRQDKY